MTDPEYIIDSEYLELIPAPAEELVVWFVIPPGHVQGRVEGVYDGP